MPRQPRISRSAAVSEALRLLDEEGLGAVTMRRLAQRLGVTSPSLYKHFRDLEDVLDAVADEVSRRISADAGGPAPWRQELTDLARRYSRTFQQHPNAMPLVMRRPLRSENSLSALDTLLQNLLDGGWETACAARAVLLVESYALGAAMTAASGGFTAGPGELGHRPALAAALGGTHPGLRLGGADFEHGLTMLLDGIARELAPAGA
ncbi:TetR/AcrR family transcriptional regulator C-terminal domain-containing protein [Streptomyces sp. HNM0574]|uniref:TetR/AcrR family transcriptional regulator n=1 Tax=Streptomyces sp. HNM0574 TaxID=2714954 RepID=UPI00146EFA98|nr:TetR/AcrR family transcriptional regulator C-terminal domain-containing protein [Streptomyces sp. HNM0574]NLU66185.1 TetR/AcrR family transcriptional regulator [Streptomyces sp. HNM0574]